ncbi:Solute carrier organic anion transporter family member 4A1 [Holothuria leucospilota]|uniref:Solute carrier organic anion transporter family member n=1 Tax=Holothuria leucospilota TaxID=206669 RepID=A0A9Q0YCM7_HOLLE|nr:Solute carrier organic anion transporter family member 4A1 [Holothuria leucospilota]
MAANGTMNDSNNASPAAQTVEESVPTPESVSKTDHGQNGIPKSHLHESESVSDFDDANVEFGWSGIRPRILQFLNRPAWFLVFLCLFAVTQGITVNGLVYVVTTTLERRFQLPSAKSGSISSAYDFSVMVVIIFVTYFGENRHKPKILAIGSLIFGLGSFVFTLPHFLTPHYQPSSGENDVCSINGTEAECSSGAEQISNYFWVFVLAQFLHGLGASPLYTLGVTYIDENVRPKLTGLYIGIFNGASLLGPAIGYLFGGALLNLYTDLTVDPSQFGIDSSNPVFIGAWWVGFLLTCTLALSLILPFLAYPKSLPGSKELAKERVSQAHGGSDFTARAGFGGGLMDFPKACLALIKNIPFMCICGAAATEWFLLAGFAVFAPKFLESQFSLSSSLAAVLVGVSVIPAGVGGSVCGGYIVKRFNLKYRGMMRFCLGTIFVSFLLMSAFFISCSDPKFAGVNVNYDGSNSIDEVNLDSTCNLNCGCDNQFQPVCGANNVIYFSPCHAGCQVSSTGEGGNMYTNCTCFGDTAEESSAMSGKCSSDCWSLPLFLILLFSLEFATVLAVVPSTTATLRCVSHSQRSFALGLQSLIYRALGTVPGPIVIGAIIDNACLLKQPTCGENDSNDTCWLYRNEVFSRSMLILAVCVKLFSILFFLGALLFYKQPPSESKLKDKMMADNETDGRKTNGHTAPLQEFT